ncbi:hypothetical protein [Haloferula sp.]|uniref:hypothetical protein n=1 Tax=Haloferula sp. TaxID=2497595 RepID=UPI003C7736A4
MKNLILAIASAAIVLLASCATTATGGMASGTKPYTKDVCIVTGNKLGSMGTPVSMVYEGQEVKLCCKPCVAKFKADPQRYLSNI